MLTDLLRPGLMLVVCGTAAGTTSGKTGHYYAKPSNKFWRTLFQVGLTSHQLQPAEYALLLKFGIGLTDIVKGQSGMDKQINFAVANHDEFRSKIIEYSPTVLCFNGKKAGELCLQRKVDFGFQAEMIGTTKLFVAPSTSGAANGSWNIGLWQELAHHLAAKK
ncbi:MAG: mismatch-specific DNA-glycosylase [Caldilineaceae bacterium]